MARTLLRIGVALVIGCALVSAATICQPHFTAGSIADSFCEVILLPGKLLAVPFHDRGNASPEFLWRSRVFGVIVFSGLTLLIIRTRTRPE
jgi:hypothetical protein